MSDTGRWDPLDPQEKLNYTLDWTTVLDGDTITGTPVWTVPGGITKLSQSNTTTTTTAVFTGGTVGTNYEINVHIVGASGLEYERTRVLKVRSK